MMPRFSIVLLTVALTGCLEQTSESSKDSKPEGAPTSRPSEDAKKITAEGRLDEKVFEHFGDGVPAAGENISIAALVDRTDELAGKKIRLTGTVSSVCKMKGCWIFVGDGDKKVRVKFKDYAFFVPKDCEGREVVVEGTFSVSKTSVAELKHLLEDEGKTEEAAKVTEPKLEMKVMADGVALKRM